MSISTTCQGPHILDRIVQEKACNWSYTQRCPSLDFEVIDPWYFLSYITDHPNWAFYAGAAYLLSILGFQRLMKNRPPFKLKTPLFLWNLGLGIFSIAGFLRTAPGLLEVLSQPGGFYRSICVREGMDVQSLFWMTAFTISKFVELGDTLFIVLRKRPLVTLQWYHHLITLTAVWLTAPMVEPITRWYLVLNFGVHALMYPYFALKAINVNIPSPIASLITSLQLIQMILGFGVNAISGFYYKSGQDCSRDARSIQLFTLVYGSFIVLFGKLFYESVLSDGRKLRQRQKLAKMN